MANEESTRYIADEVITQVQHIHLERGDILAFISDHKLTAKQAEHVLDRMKKILPEGVKAVVLEPGGTLAKVSVYKEPANG